MNHNIFRATLYTLVLIAPSSKGYTQGFQQIYGTDLENTFSKVIPHGANYYVLGQGPNSRATVTRLDAAGQIQWTQSLNIASTWNDAVLTPGGDLLLAGGTLPADNTGKGLLGRISAGGTFGFLGSYDGPGRDFFTRIVHNASPQNADFPYYVLGTQAEAGMSQEDVVLMNISQSGAINWKKIIFYTGFDDEFSRDMIALPGGDLLLGGNTNGNGILIRVDNTGQTVGGAVELESATALANASGGGGNFFVGAGESPAAVHLLKFDQDILPRWDVTIPQLSAITGIWQEPSGLLFVTGKGVFAGKIRSVILKVIDNDTTPVLIWTKYLDNGESAYTDGATAYVPSGKIAYVDGRTANPNGPVAGGAFMSVSDLDLSTCMTVEATVALQVFNPVLNGPLFPETQFYDVPTGVNLMSASIAMSGGDACQPQANCVPLFAFMPIGNCGNYRFVNQSTWLAPLVYSWNFDDPLSGANNTSSLQNPTHQFSKCGTYNVCLTITGNGCNATICHNVVFSELVPPVISNCPPNVSLSTSPGKCVFDFAGPLPIVATDNCDPNPTITCTRTDPFGNTIPLIFPAQFSKGVHVIYCEAEDDCSNISQPCTFALTIFDGEPPSLSCPLSTAYEGTLDMMGICSAAINGIGPTASDNCIMLTTEYTISGATSGTGTGDASGTVFLQGISTITYTVTDMGGNTKTCSFELEVQCQPDEDDCMEWVRQIGGNSGGAALEIALDPLGNIYTAGYFSGTMDFDPGAGVFNLSSSATNVADVFVTKLDAAGNFIWAVKMGGPGVDQAYAMTVDASGNVYTTGSFTGTADFDPGAGVFNLIAAGYDVFVSKLDASGNFVWAKSMGGSAAEIAYAIAVDVSGNVYTGGIFNGAPDFDPGAGVATLTAVGGNDAFVVKLDVSGNFVWANHFGGAGPEGVVFSLALDGLGNLYSFGEFSGTMDFDPGAAVFNIQSKGSVDIFLVKLDLSGNLVWAKQLGGIQWDRGSHVTVDALGFIYVTGEIYGIADFDPGVGVFNIGAFGGGNIFLSKLDAAGNLVWAKSMGNAFINNHGLSIAVNPLGSIYSTGTFAGTIDFDGSPGIFNVTAQSSDIYITKLGTNANFIRVKLFSGPWQKVPNSMDIDPLGCVYTTGYFIGITDFDPSANVLQLIPYGTADIFIYKMCPCNIVSTEMPVQDKAYSLSQAYPNPFNLATTIEFHMPEPAQVRLAVMDLYGREMAVLLNGRQVAGDHVVTLEAGNLPAGTYFYHLQAGAFSATRKLVVIR